MSANRAQQYDILSPDAVETRFGIRLLQYRPDEARVTMSMPAAGLTNPITGHPSLASLAVLVDDVGSTVAFARRGNAWPVTTKLTFDFSPDAVADVHREPRGDVTARGELIHADSAGALAMCDLLVGEEIIGVATVRCAYVAGDGVDHVYPQETLVKTIETDLADFLAVRAARPSTPDRAELSQLPDPMVLNATGAVHGGICAAGLEVVATALICESLTETEFATQSLGVNYLRPFAPGPEAAYIASIVHRGTTVAVADAEAIGNDGKRAAVARLTGRRTH